MKYFQECNDVILKLSICAVYHSLIKHFYIQCPKIYELGKRGSIITNSILQKKKLRIKKYGMCHRVSSFSESMAKPELETSSVPHLAFFSYHPNTLSGQVSKLCARLECQLSILTRKFIVSDFWQRGKRKGKLGQLVLRIAGELEVQAVTGESSPLFRGKNF